MQFLFCACGTEHLFNLDSFINKLEYFIDIFNELINDKLNNI